MEVEVREAEALESEGLGSATVFDEVEASRLLRGLQLLQADYERTIAAGQRSATELSAEVAESESEGESIGPDGIAVGGYAALGSDDDSDGELGGLQSGHEEEEGHARGGDRGQDQGPASSVAPASAAVLEDFADFADFSAANPALPLPPPEPPVLAAPITQDNVDLIKQVMQKVSLPPPVWAANLSDNQLEGMVRKLAESS